MAKIMRFEMEYTKSMGDYHEVFEGTPEEIGRLIDLMEGSEIDEDRLIDYI